MIPDFKDHTNVISTAIVESVLGKAIKSSGIIDKLRINDFPVPTNILPPSDPKTSL